MSDQAANTPAEQIADKQVNQVSPEQKSAVNVGPRDSVSSPSSQPPPRKFKQIENGTAHRIGILPKEQNSVLPPLVISPFGTRRVESDILDKYDCGQWESLNLIRCHDDIATEPSSDLVYAAPGCAMLIGIPIVLVGLFAPAVRQSDLFNIVVSLLILVGIVPPLIAAVRARIARNKLTSAATASGKAMVILFILLIGVGCPIVTASYFAMPNLMNLSAGGLKDTITAAVFGRTLQVVFVIIASILPGLLYFIFERQKKDMVRTTLHQQIVLLDPNGATTFDAQQQYSALIDGVYGVKGAAYYLGTGGISLIICTILLTLGWITILFPIVPTLDMALDNLPNLFAPRPSVWTFGFLGAYFFALNLVFKRYVRSDLTAKAYTHISVRILITATLAWVLSAIQGIFLDPTLPPAPILSVTAFLVGIIPETGTTLIVELWRRATGAISQSIAESDPLTKLEGINIYDRARLSEEGVDNVENLAHHNLIELLIRTRLPAPRLVDIVDQAILYLHAGDGYTETGEEQPSNQDDRQNKKKQTSERERTLQLLRRYGIRTATDLEGACSKPDSASTVAESTLFKALTETQEDSTYAARLRVILQSLYDDDWMPQLRHWRSEATLIEKNYITQPQQLFS